MSELCYFPESLNSRLAALEQAIERYDNDDFRAGAIFALGLVRLALGLETTLTIPVVRAATLGRETASALARVNPDLAHLPPGLRDKSDDDHYP